MNAQEAKKLEQKVRDTLAQYIEPTDIIVAGISGGPDSVFLLQFLPKNTVVAHLNHKLRPEADYEAEFVKKLGFKAKVKTVDLSKLKSGHEEAGRRERYKMFRELAKKHDAKYILTAHHADDNLETVLLNFTRGASLQGLSGMQELEGMLLRPLLSFSKEQITDYLEFKEIPYCKDESNKDTKYSRNFLRHEVIPKLKELNPNLTETTSKNTAALREINEELQKKAKRFLGKTPEQLNANTFRQKSRPVQREILREAHSKLIGHTKNLESVHIEEVLTLIHNNVGNKQKKLGKLNVTIKNNIITLKK